MVPRISPPTLELEYLNMSLESVVDDPAYIEPATGRIYPLSTPRWCSDAGGPLMITPLAGIGRAQIDTSCHSLWRYRASFPVPIENPITMGEGRTPLVARRWRGASVHFKLEWMSPTGSFKDRGASVMLSTLRQQGIDRVLEDSSGNGGAAVAAYAAAGGMTSKILVPAYTQVGKTVQMRAYGAETEFVSGTRQDTSAAAERQANDIFYASHAWQAYFLQGTKTLAYELWEDFGFEAPDSIIIPTGGGSNILGCDIGFSELMRQGEIERMPRLFAAQPDNCAPLHATFHSGRDALVAIDAKPTIAEGTSIAAPVRWREVLDSVRRSGGRTVALTEQEIEVSHGALARAGFYVEPTCATADAAFARLLQDGIIHPEDKTVLVLTGSGLKATQRIGELIGAIQKR